MALIQSLWTCGHAVRPQEVCWECTAQIALRRNERMRLHMDFIRRGSGSVSSTTVAEHALAEDSRFEDCAAGRHSFIDAATYGGPQPHLLPCYLCGAKPPKSEKD